MVGIVEIGQCCKRCTEYSASARSVVFGEHLFLSKAFEFVHKSKPSALQDHRLSIYNRYLWLCRKNWAQPRTSSLQRWYVASKYWYLPIHRETVVQVSLLSQISIRIHLTYCLSALFRGSCSSCVTTWQFYGKPFWSSSLGSFQSQVPRPGFFAFLWGSFSKGKLWPLLFPPSASLLLCTNRHLQKEAKVSPGYFLPQ